MSMWERLTAWAAKHGIRSVSGVIHDEARFWQAYLRMLESPAMGRESAAMDDWLLKWDISQGMKLVPYPYDCVIECEVTE
jgi:hypothetical protein